MAAVTRLVEVQSFYAKLTADGLGLAVDLMKDLFKAALLGAGVSVVNLFATEQNSVNRKN